jgi:uncharacterized membrane protein
MKKSRTALTIIAMVIIAVVLLFKGGQHGKFLGIPYDFRTPNWRILQEKLWNPGNPDILTPHVFGWGYSINFGAIAKKLGLVGKGNGA